MPGMAKKRHPLVEARMKTLQGLAETSDLNRIENPGKKIGVITSSTSYQYTQEVFGKNASILKIGMAHPLPVQKILDFARDVERLIVIEELDPIIEAHCNNLGLTVEGKDKLSLMGEYTQNIVSEALDAPACSCEQQFSIDDEIPLRPPVMCPGCPHRGIFYSLKKQKVTALGDIGCYTLGAIAPLQMIDMSLCMGASVSATHGFNKVLGSEAEKKTVAVIGDSTFMHSGMTGLANISYNQSNSTTIILDNSITGMTGQQHNPTTGYNIKGEPAGKIDLEALCHALGIRRVAVVDPYDLKACDAVIKEELAAEEPSVIISRRPCVLLKGVEMNTPLVVNEDTCIGCKACMRIGCPALSMKDKVAHVDPTLCVGCDVCAQLCPVDAFERPE
ncbi:MAG: 4Fe-4S binding protein, partial [Eggerthellaceae bacterium]|nr:4Fe-4S binding protein [Eggerthellaceae bacterium]